MLGGARSTSGMVARCWSRRGCSPHANGGCAQTVPASLSNYATIRSRSGGARELSRRVRPARACGAPDFAPRDPDLRAARALPWGSGSLSSGLNGRTFLFTQATVRSSAAVVSASVPWRPPAIGTDQMLNNPSAWPERLPPWRCAREWGARIVWLPTVSGRERVPRGRQADPDGQCRYGVRFEHRTSGACGRCAPEGGTSVLDSVRARPLPISSRGGSRGRQSHDPCLPAPGGAPRQEH